MKNVKPIYISLGAILLIILMFNGCTSRPDAGDVEDDLKNRIENDSKGEITLLDFEQTNAVEQDVFGQKHYTIFYKAKIRFEKDCYIYVNKSGMGRYFESFETYTKEKPEFFPSLSRMLVRAEKGDEIEFKDKVTYLETENGWVRAVEPKLF